MERAGVLHINDIETVEAGIEKIGKEKAIKVIEEIDILPKNVREALSTNVRKGASLFDITDLFNDEEVESVYQNYGSVVGKYNTPLTTHYNNHLVLFDSDIEVRNAASIEVRSIESNSDFPKKEIKYEFNEDESFTYSLECYFRFVSGDLYYEKKYENVPLFSNIEIDKREHITWVTINFPQIAPRHMGYEDLKVGSNIRLRFDVDNNSGEIIKASGYDDSEENTIKYEGELDKSELKRILAMLKVDGTKSGLLVEIPENGDGPKINLEWLIKKASELITNESSKIEDFPNEYRPDPNNIVRWLISKSMF